MGIISNNKNFFLFLLKFGVAYLVLAGLYMLYLSPYPTNVPVTDPVTYTVAKQSSWLINFFGYDATTAQHTSEASHRIFIDGKSLVRVVEGCNAMSVMILFTAFIIAFSTTFKRTALYIISGLLIVYLLNVLRIALICIAIYHYPQYLQLLHDVLFPLFIYGVVFALWVLWVLKFYKHGKKTAA